MRFLSDNKGELIGWTFSTIFSTIGSSSSLHAEAPKGDEGTSMSFMDSLIGFSVSAGLISEDDRMDKSAKGLYMYC